MKMIDLISLIVSAFSGLCSAVAAVAAVYALKFARDSYQMQQQQNEAEKPNLEVRICPTRNGLTQLAQFMITNKSRRPIHIQAWAVRSANKAISSLGVREMTGHPYGGKLPKILAEQERMDIIADLTGTDWKNMISAGIYDNTNRFWPVPETAIKQFIETAERYAPQP